MLITATQRHAVIAGERAHPPRAAVEKGLSAAVVEAGDEAADAAEVFAEGTTRRNRFEQHAAVDEVERNIDGRVLLEAVPSSGSFGEYFGSVGGDRKSTRLNSSHSQISYAV